MSIEIPNDYNLIIMFIKISEIILKVDSDRLVIRRNLLFFQQEIVLFNIIISLELYKKWEDLYKLANKIIILIKTVLFKVYEIIKKNNANNGYKRISFIDKI